jgi:alpha-amylase
VVSICFYFQVHQPFRLGKYQVFDIGSGRDYFDKVKNRAILHKVATKCYLPANRILLELLNTNPKFKISFSFSGVFLEQCGKYCPEVLESFQKLMKTGQVEILAETYYHSLAFLYSEEEFEKQVRLHEKQIKKLFGVKPTVFRNTELIYNNALAQKVEKMGYKAVLLEGWDQILTWRSPNFVYKPVNSNIQLLLKNYKLSDDIAFRFSNQGWKEHPLSVEKYSQWVNAINGNGNTVNLFMDYETFGEHQWESTGIFEFLRHLPGELLKNPDNDFKFPSEVATDYPSVGELDIHYPLSWADVERDVSAWLGNDMQKSAIRKLYAMEKEIKDTKNEKLIEDWRKLQTSDHFYYMCTKWFNDGDVHKYFSPYESSYDAFIYFMNIFKDLSNRLNELKISIQTNN